MRIQRQCLAALIAVVAKFIVASPDDDYNKSNDDGTIIQRCTGTNNNKCHTFGNTNIPLREMQFYQKKPSRLGSTIPKDDIRTRVFGPSDLRRGIIIPGSLGRNKVQKYQQFRHAQTPHSSPQKSQSYSGHVAKEIPGDAEYDSEPVRLSRPDTAKAKPLIFNPDRSDFIPEIARYPDPDYREYDYDVSRSSSESSSVDDIMSNLFRMSIFGQMMKKETEQISPSFGAVNHNYFAKENDTQSDVTTSTTEPELTTQGESLWVYNSSVPIIDFENKSTFSDEKPDKIETNLTPNNEWYHDLINELIGDSKHSLKDTLSEFPSLSAFLSDANLNIDDNDEDDDDPSESQSQDESVENHPDSSSSPPSEPQSPSMISLPPYEYVEQQYTHQETTTTSQQVCPATCTCSCSSPTTTATTTTTARPPSQEPSHSIKLTLGDDGKAAGKDTNSSESLNLNLSLYPFRYPCARSAAYQLDLAIKLCRPDED